MSRPMMLRRTWPSAVLRSAENQLALPSGPRWAMVARAPSRRSAASQGARNCAAINPHIRRFPRGQASKRDRNRPPPRRPCSSRFSAEPRVKKRELSDQLRQAEMPFLGRCCRDAEVEASHVRLASAQELKTVEGVADGGNGRLGAAMCKNSAQPKDRGKSLRCWGDWRPNAVRRRRWRAGCARKFYRFLEPPCFFARPRSEADAGVMARSVLWPGHPRGDTEKVSAGWKAGADTGSFSGWRRS